MPPPGSSSFENIANSREIAMRQIRMEQEPTVKPKDGNCKLFGIPLIGSPAAQVTSVSDEPATLLPPMLKDVHNVESDRNSQQSKGSKPIDSSPAGNEKEKKMQSSQSLPHDSQTKNHVGSSRSCTKVHKQGIALGRSVDLSKFNNYDELVAELDRLFDFNGELKAPEDWLIVYTDDEGDMMLVGDDPWQEFCGMVRKIYIYTKEEVQKMTPRKLNPRKSEENLPATEGTDSKEVKQSLPSSVLNAQSH